MPSIKPSGTVFHPPAPIPATRPSQEVRPAPCSPQPPTSLVQAHAVLLHIGRGRRSWKLSRLLIPPPSLLSAEPTTSDQKPNAALYVVWNTSRSSAAANLLRLRTVRPPSTGPPRSWVQRALYQTRRPQFLEAAMPPPHFSCARAVISTPAPSHVAPSDDGRHPPRRATFLRSGPAPPRDAPRSYKGRMLDAQGARRGRSS